MERTFISSRSFNKQQQLKIITTLLEDARQKANNEEITAIIGQCSIAISSNASSMAEYNQQSQQRISQMLAELEQHPKGQSTLAYLASQGLNRMVYRHGVMQGQEEPKDDLFKTILQNGFIGIGISALFIAAFAASVLFSAPLWITAIATGLFTGACAYLGGLLYGVVNDLFATKANLPYFLLGHQPQQISLLQTNDPKAQGIAWGVAASFGPVLLASIVFAIAVTITAFFVPVATFLLPLVIVAMPLIAVAAEWYARKKAVFYATKGYPLGENCSINAKVMVRRCTLRGNYQREGLARMSPTNEESAAWLANSNRNMFGFTKVPFIALGVLGTMIGLSAGGVIPALAATTLLSVVVPVIGAALAFVALVTAGIYMYRNRHTLHDNRYRLEFDEEQVKSIGTLSLEDPRDYQYAEGICPQPVTKTTAQPRRTKPTAPASDEENSGAVYQTTSGANTGDNRYYLHSPSSRNNDSSSPDASNAGSPYSPG